MNYLLSILIIAVLDPDGMVQTDRGAAERMRPCRAWTGRPLRQSKRRAEETNYE